MPKALNKRLHFIGIGGSGMRPLAEIALAQGFLVSGSDQASSESLESLERRGAKIYLGHTADALPFEEASIIASSAIPSENPELKAAMEKGWSILHRSDLLKALMQGKKSICVSGTHGKTSTTAMLAFMLKEMGQNPTAAIGGELVGYSSYSLTGDGPYFVAECDESDGSFLKYKPYISIITNIDLDHLDFYKDLNGLKDAFLEFLNQTDPEGMSILGWDNPSVREIAQLYTGPRLSFGTRIGTEVRGLKFFNQGRHADYELVVDKTLVKNSAPLVGKHSLQNILCCLSVAHALNLDVHQAATALKSYPGVKRRFSLVEDFGNIKIFDDYAHNPGKIRSCIEGARSAFPKDKIIVIFQPHRYSRLETMYTELMSSFSDSDEVFVTPVYTAGETSQKEFSPESIARDLSQHSQVSARPYDSIELKKRLSFPCVPTVLITIGAGDVWRLSLEWKDYLHGQAEQKGRTTL